MQWSRASNKIQCLKPKLEGVSLFQVAQWSEFPKFVQLLQCLFDSKQVKYHRGRWTEINSNLKTYSLCFGSILVQELNRFNRQTIWFFETPGTSIYTKRCTRRDSLSYEFSNQKISSYKIRNAIMLLSIYFEEPALL